MLQVLYAQVAHCDCASPPARRSEAVTEALQPSLQNATFCTSLTVTVTENMELQYWESESVFKLTGVPRHCLQLQYVS
jgi:hypothetical protein